MGSLWSRWKQIFVEKKNLLNKSKNMEKENVKWEYKITLISNLHSKEDYIMPNNANKRKTYIKEILNEMGDEGWEVCGYECGTYLLKRIKQE